jgi:hypothetical protein
MRDDTLARYTGAFAAVGGGGLAVTSFAATAAGSCQEPLCPLETVTSGPPPSVTGLIVVLSLMMLAAAGVGLVVLVGRRGALRFLGAVPAAVGAVACAIGFMLLLSVIGLSDGPVGPYPEDIAVGVGVIAAFAGITVIGCALLGIRGLSQAIGAFLCTGALLLAASINDSMPAGALSVVCGMCWCAGGALLLLPAREGQMTERSARRSVTAAD